MSKTEIAQIPLITLNFNTIQLSEFNTLKRKSDRICLPSEPSKKIKSYFNQQYQSLDNIENNCSLNNSSIDSSDNCSTNENYENENKTNECYTFFNQNLNEEHIQSSSPCTPQNQIIIEEEPSHSQIKPKSDIQFSQEGYCINYEDRTYSNIYSDENQNVSMIIGYLCLAFAAVFFTSTLFSIFFAPLLQPTTHKLVEFLRTDNFYCFLIPLSLPILCITIYMNWVAMKYFKHS